MTQEEADEAIRAILEDQRRSLNDLILQRKAELQAAITTITEKFAQSEQELTKQNAKRIDRIRAQIKPASNKPERIVD
jgi:hypothetical protein